MQTSMPPAPAILRRGDSEVDRVYNEVDEFEARMQHPRMMESGPAHSSLKGYPQPQQSLPPYQQAQQTRNNHVNIVDFQSFGV